MKDLAVVSFDVEGTLVTTDFSAAVWFEAIPAYYARLKGISPPEARAYIEGEYGKVGDQRIEWYDIEYWCHRFGLGRYEQILESCQDRIKLYPEVSEVLGELYGKYPIVAASGSPRQFLDYFMKEIGHQFGRVFSSVSDYRLLKTADFYQAMCRDLRAEPAQVAHVGDNRQFDFENPRQVGVRAFHLDRKGQKELAETVVNLKDFVAQLVLK